MLHVRYVPHLFSGVLYHGDLIEKLKILYKMHVMPGGCAAVSAELKGDLEL